jgi:hypothetical protein
MSWNSHQYTTMQLRQQVLLLHRLCMKSYNGWSMCLLRVLSYEGGGAVGRRVEGLCMRVKVLASDIDEE